MAHRSSRGRGLSAERRHSNFVKPSARSEVGGQTGAGIGEPISRLVATWEKLFRFGSKHHYRPVAQSEPGSHASARGALARNFW